MVYYDTKDVAAKDIARRQREREEHGVALVTAEDRQWIAFLKTQLGGNLSHLPDVLQHWRATGAGSIVPTTVESAVAAFLDYALPNVKHRTASDIKSHLGRFAREFTGREMHSLHVGELERWLASFSNQWTRRSYWKRIAPLFDYGVRQRWLTESPLALLEASQDSTCCPGRL